VFPNIDKELANNRWKSQLSKQEKDRNEKLNDDD